MGKKSKIFISILLSLHLFAVIFMPNPRSFVVMSVSNVLLPYMGTLGLSHTWGFFAPEPISPPMYIDYVFELKSGEKESGRYPAEKNPYPFRDQYNRRMSMSKIVLSSDENLRNMFMRYMCNKNQEIISAKLWRVTGIQPSLEMVQKGERKMTDAIDYKIDVLGTYFCTEEK